MEESSSFKSGDLVKYGLSFLILGFMPLYILDFLGSFPLKPVYACFWLFLAAVAVFIYAGKFLSRYRKLYAVLCLGALWCVYAFRVLPDLYTSYLWAEDGMELIEDAISGGAATLFDHPAGYWWFLPRLISLLCYRVCMLFGGISFLPVLQGFMSKIIAAGSLLYFMSDRFEWLIKSRVRRFAVCVLVVLSIPQSSFDMVPVDTSLPFVMNFTVFLIGLDALLGPKARPVTIFETVFLSLLALSTASAPFCAAVPVLALGRWLIFNKEKKEHVPMAVACTLIVSVCALLQTLTTLLSPREISDISIGRRLFVCVHDFVFFPYLESYSSAWLWIAGLAAWLAVACLAKTNWKILLYSAVFAYSFLFYCSMVGAPDVITDTMTTGVGARYYMMSYMIAAFLLGVHICRMSQSDKVRKSVSVVLCLMIFFMAGPSYFIDIPNPSLASAYDYACGLLNTDGDEKVVIPVAPTTHFRMMIPFDIDAYEPASSEPQFVIETVGDQDPAGMVILDRDVSEHSVTGWAADAEGRPFEYVFIEWEEGQYNVPVEPLARPDVAESLQSEDDMYGFIFDVDTGILSRGELRFAGISSDGQLYRWSISPAIVVE